MANKFTDAVFFAHFPDVQLGGKYPQRMTGMAIKAVAYAVAWHTDDEYGHCWPGYDLIAEEANTNRSTAVRGVAALEQLGVLVRISSPRAPKDRRTKQNSSKASNTYIVDLGILESMKRSSQQRSASDPQEPLPQGTVAPSNGDRCSQQRLGLLLATVTVAPSNTNSSLNSSGNTAAKASGAPLPPDKQNHGGCAPKPPGGADAPSTPAVSSGSGQGAPRRLGFDPFSVQPFDGWTPDQIKTVSLYFWTYGLGDPWFREKVRDAAYFRKQFGRMAQAVPEGWKPRTEFFWDKSCPDCGGRGKYPERSGLFNVMKHCHCLRAVPVHEAQSWATGS